MQRYGMVIGVKADQIEEYKRLHAAAWPDVLAMIRECHIRSYSIHVRKMVADETTQRWWDECMPCQEPSPDRCRSHRLHPPC